MRGLDLPHSLVVLDAAERLIVADLVVSPNRADYANQTLRQAASAPIAEAVGWVRGQRSTAAALAFADPRRESPVE